KSRNSGKAGRQVVRLVVAAGHDHLVSALLATRLLLQAQRAVAEPAADQPPEVRGQVDITASSDLGHGQGLAEVDRRRPQAAVEVLGLGPLRGAGQLVAVSAP